MAAFQLLLVSRPRFDIKLSSSSRVRVRNYRSNNKKYESNKYAKFGNHADIETLNHGDTPQLEPDLD